jgi:hypothetical protein
MVSKLLFILILISKAYGSGYAWSNTILTINSGDTVTWSWSPPSLVTGLSYQVVQVGDAASTSPLTNGFSSGNATASGNKLLSYFEH